MFLSILISKAQFTWMEDNPPSIVFPSFVDMPGRVTLGGRSPHLLRRIALLGGLTFVPCKRSRWGYPPARVKFLAIGLLSHLCHL